MTEVPDRNSLLSSARDATLAQRRRLSEVRAREHVGAAGWAQTTALEALLRAGREGLAATDALRQVVRLTTEQLRALPLVSVGEQGEDHLKALQDIVHSGEQQLTAAQALEGLVCQALDDVTRVATDELNVTRLKYIHQRLQEQVVALNTIVDSARVQAQTLEQVTELEQVSADHQNRVNDLRLFSAQEEISVLGEAGEDIVNRIAEIDEAHPQQLDALKQIGEAVVEKLPETGAHPQQQAETLEQLAQAAQEKADELRKEQG